MVKGEYHWGYYGVVSKLGPALVDGVVAGLVCLFAGLGLQSVVGDCSQDLSEPDLLFCLVFQYPDQDLATYFVIAYMASGKLIL